MSSPRLSAFAALLLAAGLVHAQTNQAKELERWRGEWTISSLEIHGCKAQSADLGRFKVRFAAGKLITAPGFGVIVHAKEKSLELVPKDRPDETHILRVDPSRSPPTLDLEERTGPKRSLIKGIYRLEGNKLRICASPARRPSQLIAGAPATFLLVLQRTKK